MASVLLVIHIFVAIALVGVILLQRSEGGGLGFGASGGGGGSNSFMSVRGTANLLTRTTAILAGLFMATSLWLAILNGNHGQGSSILDQLPADSQTPAAPTDTTVPAAPAIPEVPLSK